MHQKLFIWLFATTLVLGTSLDLSGQDRDHSHEEEIHEHKHGDEHDEMPKALRNVLEMLDVDNEDANVNVEIEKEDGRTVIHIVVETARHEDHKHDNHKHKEEKDHIDWERKLNFKAREIEKELGELNGKLEEARGKFQERHPVVHKLKQKIGMLESVMNEIEEKLESFDDERGEEADREEMDEANAYRYRIKEIEQAMEERERGIEELIERFTDEHPKVRKMSRELDGLERALHESIEALERIEEEQEEEDERHEEEDEIIEEVFNRFDDLDERMDGLEERLEAILGILEDRD